MSPTIDQIASPEAYRASILAALGDDDPVIAHAGRRPDRQARPTP